MELLRVALARVCRKGRLPKLVGLQISNSSRCSLMLGIGGKDFYGKSNALAATEGAVDFSAGAIPEDTCLASPAARLWAT
jgi:hypothetical protein